MALRSHASRIGGGFIVLGVLLLTSGLSVAAMASPADKIDICHYSGRAGTDRYQTLSLPPSAAYSHIDEHGTSQAGHEDDYLGSCDLADEVDSSTTTSSTSSTSSTSTSTTSSTSSTSTTLAVEDAFEENQATTTTSTTLADVDTVDLSPEPPVPPTSPTTPPGPGDAPAKVVDVVSTTESGTAPTEIAELPFTGPSTYLILPGLFLTVVGGLAVFVTYGFGAANGGHVAFDQPGFRLGLHRGRHELGS